MDNQPAPAAQQPAPVTDPVATSPITPPTISSGPNRKIIIPVVILGILILVGIGYYLKINVLSLKKQNAPTVSIPKGAIAKVGEEYLYQKDLDIEVAAYPPSSGSADVKKNLLAKMVNDSIIIQGALSDKIASADATIFNSPNKNYPKRIKLISDIEAIIKNKSDHISGTVVSMWIVNGDESPLGYDKSKEIVGSKITSLQQKVKSGSMTIQDAIKTIQNDTSLAQIDKTYKTNAFFNFNVESGQKITFDPQFDKILRSTPKGAITDLYLAKLKDKISGQMMDTVYMFGTVSEIISSPVKNFGSWLDLQRGKYAVTYY